MESTPTAWRAVFHCGSFFPLVLSDWAVRVPLGASDRELSVSGGSVGRAPDGERESWRYGAGSAPTNQVGLVPGATRCLSPVTGIWQPWAPAS